MPESKIVEVTNDLPGGGLNYGKFMLLRWTAEEWAYRSRLPGYDSPLMRSIGHDRGHLWVLDLQTCEGAMFRPGGHAHNDLQKHRIWVCPLYEPFLAWLYKQPDPWAIPECVRLAVPGDFAGYRRPGPEQG